MAATTARQLFIKSDALCCNQMLISAHHPITKSLAFSRTSSNDIHSRNSSPMFSLVSSTPRPLTVVVKSSVGTGGVVATDDEGVSLGTMKLPLNIDISRFETLLFQWANSLCQGAQMPLPVPLKVDKIEGGVRIGFVEIDDGKTNVSVYIDCVVISGSNESDPPKFIAARKGALKNKVPLGEPRIMKSLLAALQKSVEIASL